MRRPWVYLAGALVLGLACTGCAKKKAYLRSDVIGPVTADPQMGIIEEGYTGPVKTHFVDRHPLLYKPKDVYHTTNHGPVIKTMAATVVGVPVGIACEVGQIVKGCPRDAF